MAGPLNAIALGTGRSTFDLPAIKLTIDDQRLFNMFAVAPAIVAKWMRDVFGQFAGSHRKAVVAGLSGGYLRLVRKSLFYSVFPRQKGKTAGKGFDFSRGVKLENIRLRIYATSRVTLIHETGGTIVKKGKDMAIPVSGSAGNLAIKKGKKKGGTPAHLAAAGAKFVRRGNVLFQVVANAKGKERLKATHLLTGSVQIKPALGIIRHWNSLEGDRKRRLEKNIGLAAAEMASVAAKAIGNVISGALRRVA